ncbi:MAG: hypothetical protein QXL67_04370 [Candidatus Bathyarchaeia archaeon]
MFRTYVFLVGKKGLKGKMEDQLNLQVDTADAPRRVSLAEEERRRYLKVWRITYIVIPLVYFLLTLIFH